MIQPIQRQKPPLFEYAYFGNFEDVLKSLNEMAMSESWEYSKSENKRPLPILFNYIQHTYVRLKEESKICEKDDFSCFNTGLVTENQEEIFMLFKKNKIKNSWTFLELKKESSHDLVRFGSLPERAIYFQDPSDLMFHPKYDLRINIDHIVEDENNFARFPKDIQALSKHQLINTFKGAIEHARKRIKINYKTAIPQYYRGYIPNGQLQLLLPLCLKDPTKADLALAIYKTDNSYMGRTCLTLDMAINNARLIAKPDDEWLKA